MITPVADFRGTPPLWVHFFIFMRFSREIGEIIGWVWEILDPPLYFCFLETSLIKEVSNWNYLNAVFLSLQCWRIFENMVAISDSSDCNFIRMFSSVCVICMY